MALDTTRGARAAGHPKPQDGGRKAARAARLADRLARLRRDRLLLLFALPGVAVVLLFCYLPLLGNVIAFKDYQPFLGIAGSPWTGLHNFDVILGGDAEFMTALRNTLIVAFAQVILVFPVPIAVALLLNSLVSERIKRVVQSVLYLPHFMSWVIVVALFQSMLGNAGMLNTWLAQHGSDGFHLIGDPGLFKVLITSQVIWKDTGWGTILFLAALSRIDISLYESAAVDGASRMRQLWHVTLPGIKGVIVLMFILKLGDSLNIGFEQILLQQAPVGTDASEVLDTYVYNHGVINGDWGVSAAVGLVKGLVSVVLVLGANRIAHIFGERGVYES